MSPETRSPPLIAVVALMTTVSLSPAAHGNETRDTLTRQLESARQMPLALTWPAATGFSPARPVTGFTAAPDNQWMKTPWRSATGCVAFFYAPDDADLKITEVAFKWQGPACNGKPLNGTGELQIRYQDNGNPRISVLKGGFVNGVLNGQGSKRNFSFTPQGAREQNTYLFDGVFANNVLHGEGRMRWIGAADARPRAWQREGRFKQGTLGGQAVQSRLAPYPGIEAETLQLWFNKDGEPYNNQEAANRGEPVSGRLQFAGDPSVWHIDLIGYQNDGSPAATLSRPFSDGHTILLAQCMRWRLDGPQPRCPEGDLRYGMNPALTIEQGGFVLNTPVRAGRTPFRALAGATIGFNSVLAENEHYPLRCDEDVSVCTGTGLYPSELSNMHWQGRFEWRREGITPVSGSLYRRDNASSPASRQDAHWADCRRFDGPLSCSDGALLQRYATFHGAWLYRKPDTEYRGYMDDDAPRDLGGFQNRGWGTLAFSDQGDGRSARVRFNDEGKIVEVGDCEIPDTDDDVSCSLRGDSVFFSRRSTVIYERPVRQPDTTRSGSSGNNGRFKPVEVPKRTPYILPGMK